MAETTSAAAKVAPIPSAARLKAAERFTREPFVHDGEDPATALAAGTPRRRALDRALAEIDEGLKVPSTKWRRRYSLLLGLERVLSQDEPRLADGTLLNPHQVDALSGTLAALLTAAQGNGTAVPTSTSAPVLAIDETSAYAQPAEAVAPERPADEAEPEEPEDDLDEDDEDDDDDDLPEVEVEVEAEADDEDEDDEPDEAESYEDDRDDDLDEDVAPEGFDDPNAHKRFWFEHATGAGKTVAAMGFVDASRTGGTLILTHRRNLVDQFNDELTTRGYADRISPPLLGSAHNDRADGPVTVETYQWFVRNAGQISPCYTVVICDEAHTALGEKTSEAIREWTGPIFVGMTATGALIARHVTDLFPTQTSRFDLAQAARRGVIAPLRGIRIPPGVGVRSIAKVPLRKGEVDMEFDQEMLAELLDQLPFNLAIADLYKTRFNGVPGVVYAAGVKHAYNVAEAFREIGIKAQAVSGETPKRELAEILAAYERGDVDVLVNAQLLAEGWNSPRATVCMHLAPTASKRIYQQRVGRVTRRHLGKEAGVVVDFVHPATKNDDPVVTLHSLLDRDVYRGGAIVVGPVRRGRGRRVRVERRVIPVTHVEERRHEVFERELWRIAVEFLDWGEQHMWSALAGARVAPSGWRRARAMLHFDRSGELKRRFLLTALERNKNAQLRIRALQEIAQAKDPEAFEAAVDIISLWPREEKREGVKVLLLALAEKRIGRRDQASQWIWDLADMTREVHEEYAVQRWPETKRLLGLLVNSSGGAHGRNARRLVHASRKQDRRLQAAVLAAAVPHTPEGMEVIRGARTRLARKPSALSRELLRNFPKGRGRRGRRRKKKGGGQGAEVNTPAPGVEETTEVTANGAPQEYEAYSPEVTAADKDKATVAAEEAARAGTGRRSRARRRKAEAKAEAARAAAAAGNSRTPAGDRAAGDDASAEAQPSPDTGRDDAPQAAAASAAAPTDDAGRTESKPAARRRAARKPAATAPDVDPVEAIAAAAASLGKPDEASPDGGTAAAEPAAKKAATRKPAAKKAAAKKPAAKKPAAKKPAAKKAAAKKPAARKPAAKKAPSAGADAQLSLDAD